MQILLGLLIGAVVGLAAHFALAHRDTRGAALAPMAGAAASGIIWTASTWAGLEIGSPVLWLVAILAPAVTVIPLVLFLTRRRLAADADARARAGV